MPIPKKIYPTAIMMNNFHNIYNETNYKSLFKEFYRPAVLFACHIIHDVEAAKDIAQDLFVLLWEKKLPFENELLFCTYLYRSLHHKCLNYMRGQRNSQNSIEKRYLETEQAEAPSILHNLIREEVYRQLQESIEQLPPQCRKICQMTLAGKKPSAIAKELNLKVDTVKKQKDIALKRLKSKFNNNLLMSFILTICFP